MILLILPVAAQAQEIVARLDLGRKDPIPKDFHFSPIDRGLVTVGNLTRKSSRYIALSKYDENFNKEWTKQVFEQNGRKNIDFLTVSGENILLFVSEYFSREKTIRTYYYHYDLEGNLLQDKKVISELPNEKEHRVDLRYVRSLNKKKLLCYKNLNSTNDNEKILYYLFDEETDLVREGEMFIPYPDEKFEERKVIVSNQGNIYFMGKFYKENRVRSADDFEYIIYRFKEGNEKGDKYVVDAGDKFLTDLNFKVDPFENMFLAGFYSERDDDQIIGTLYQKVSKDGELEISQTQKFDEKFLSEFLTDRQIDRGRELKYFYLDDIILRSDGGVLLIGEKFYTTVSSYLDLYGYWVDQKIYHYEEIIVNSVSPDGEQEWSSVVKKRQASELREHLSYMNMVTGQNIYLIYQYHPKKENRSVYHNWLDFEGNVSRREPLLSRAREKSSLYPRKCEQISNREALVVYFTDRGKVYSIVKMEFD